MNQKIAKKRAKPREAALNATATAQSAFGRDGLARTKNQLFQSKTTVIATGEMIYRCNRKNGAIY